MVDKSFILPIIQHSKLNTGKKVKKMPWSHHYDLSETRLFYLAKLLVECRRSTLELYDEAGGDTPWGLGCRAYDRTRSLIVRAAATQPWLSVLDDSLHLVFQIGSVPVRFYRGLADKPKANTLACDYPELRQLTLAFEDKVDPLIWRFSIETDVLGDVSRIVFIGTNASGDVLCQWDAPNTVFDTDFEADALHESSDGVQIGAPTVVVRDNKKSIKQKKE